MAKDVTRSAAVYTAETIRPFVASFHCGAEVVDNRYADVTKVSGPGRIADDVLQAACIVGTEVKDWQKVDFAGMTASLCVSETAFIARPSPAMRATSPKWF